jgi:deoxyribodipyrimidine photolyase-related protein
MNALILFPHQLYFTFPKKVTHQTSIYLVEEFLFFKQYLFHKQKLIYHRATLQAYTNHLKEKGFQVNYVATTDHHADARHIISAIKTNGVQELIAFEPDDFLLKKRLIRSAKKENVSLEFFENQQFINTQSDLQSYQKSTKKLFQTDFYIHQRKKYDILLDDLGSAIGGKWSFDAENRKKYPSSKKAPALNFPKNSRYLEEAKTYVQENFPLNPGEINSPFTYPITPMEAKNWLDDFFALRFSEFGLYEDAIVSKENLLHHSLLTPMLNTGILKPQEVLKAAIEYANEKNIELNNLEGFVRQILGWREFVRYVYGLKGVEQRTRNFWGFERKMPKSFYEGTTGIRPVDDAIQKLKSTAYNHHIERLMILSNFMMLCEIHPDEVYQWFMEMYIDAYDWVMVPNVYGMGQFSDGGLMVTKPYISGSNYIFKMSDYKKGEEWADIWDALFWRFMSVHRDFLKKNPRLSMLISTFDKWAVTKRTNYLNKAEDFLKNLK